MLTINDLKKNSIKKVFFDFKTLIYNIKKQNNMKHKIENKKISISITLDSDLLKIVNENYTNRSKFLQNCIIEELCKNDMIKEELKNKKIIL